MKQPPIDRHHIQVPRTARYFTIGGIHADVGHAIIALHGYGQSAQNFAKAFRSFAGPDTLLVFPEGLSRFYNRNRDNQVGASWMTSEDRKSEIRDYIGYLNETVNELYERGLPREVRLTVIGFSQGTATASRWLAAGPTKAARLVLWGGLPGFELIDDQFLDRIPDTEVVLVTGTGDKYAPPDKVREAELSLSKGDRSVQTIIYEGGHVIDQETLTGVMARSV